MTPALIEAAVRLADVLARENQALAALDLVRAASMLEDKQRLAAAFAAAQAELPAALLSRRASDQQAARELAARLGELARENQRLLERAIGVQGRVVATVAEAAQPAPRHYGARGAPKPDSKIAPLAFSARA